MAVALHAGRQAGLVKRMQIVVANGLDTRPFIENAEQIVNFLAKSDNELHLP